MADDIFPDASTAADTGTTDIGTATDATTTDTTAADTGADTSQAAADTTQTVEPQDVAGIRAALLAERRARQEEQHARQELERRLAEQQTDKQTFWDDPEGALAQIEDRAAQMTINMKLDLSEAYARDKYADFQEKADVFMNLVQSDPSLINKMRSDVNPAEFVYRTAQKEQRMQQLGNVDDLEKAITERVKAQVEAEYKAKFEELSKKANLPPSLAGARGAAGTTAPAWTGPEPLTELFK